jgi:TonB family protein
MATQSTDTKPRVRTQADELMVIAQRAQAFTNASGTAIALSEGSAEELTCRARSGSAAPEVGTTMRLEGSFTGLCVQSGKELRCDDAETDTRVDTNAIRTLGIRSMVVTPIKEDNKVIGVLACFAPTAHAFTITHVAVLKTMADQISGLLQRDRRMREEGVIPEPAPTATFPKTAPSMPAPAPVVIKPAVSNGNGTAVAPAKSAFPVVSRVEIAKPAESTAIAPPKREERRPEARANFGTLDAMTKESKSGANFKMIAAVAVVVVAALGTFAFLKMRKPAAPTPAPVSQVAASTPATQPQETNNSQIQISATPATGSAQNNSVASSNPVSSETAKPTRASLESSKKSEKSSARNSEKAVAEEPEAKPTPATVALNRGPSRIGSAAAVAGGEVSPTLAVESSSATGTISALTIPVNTTAPAALRQSNLEPMQVLKTVPPIYPPIAKMRRLSGQVTVEFTVGKDGKAHNPKLLSGQAAFRDAAFEAVRQWTFKPAKLDGKPVEQTTQVKMDFHP